MYERWGRIDEARGKEIDRREVKIEGKQEEANQGCHGER